MNQKEKEEKNRKRTYKSFRFVFCNQESIGIRTG